MIVQSCRTYRQVTGKKSPTTTHAPTQLQHKSYRTHDTLVLNLKACPVDLKCPKSLGPLLILSITRQWREGHKQAVLVKNVLKLIKNLKPNCSGVESAIFQQSMNGSWPQIRVESKGRQAGK